MVCLEIMVETFRQLVLLVARLFALAASACCVSSLSFVSLGHSLARGHTRC